MWRFYFSFIAAWWNTLKRWDLHILRCCNWSRNLVWQFRTFAINARLRVQTTGAHAVKHDDIWWIDLQKFSLKFWHVVFINKVTSDGSKGTPNDYYSSSLGRLRPKMFSIWQNHMLVSPLPKGWRPLLQGSLDPLLTVQCRSRQIIFQEKMCNGEMAAGICCRCSPV